MNIESTMLMVSNKLELPRTSKEEKQTVARASSFIRKISPIRFQLVHLPSQISNPQNARPPRSKQF